MCIHGFIALEIGTSARRMMQSLALGKQGRIYMTLFQHSSKENEKMLHIMQIAIQKRQKFSAVRTMDLFTVLTISFGPVQRTAL
jgi:hypothetical protein